MTIELEPMETDLLPSSSLFVSDTTTHISNREDASAIAKTMQCAQCIGDPMTVDRAIRITEPPSNAYAVCQAAEPLLTSRPIESMIEERNGKADELLQLINGKSEGEPEENFIVKLGRLVRDILHLTHLISEKDRTRTEEMKLKYHRLCDESADSQKSKGNTSVGIAVLSFCVQFGALAFSNENDQKMVRMIAEQIPQLGSFFTSRQDASIGKTSQEMNLLNTEISTISNNQSSQSGWKEQMQAALNEARQWMAKASNSNG